MKKLWGQLRQQHRYLFAVLAGLLLAAAFPKINLAGAAWIAPALVLACAYGKTGAAAWRIGYVAGLSHWLALLSWLLHIPVPGFPILGWIALAAFLAIYPATWVWFLTGRIGQGSWLRRCFWALGGAAVWVALEMIRARLLTGFPWNSIGTSQWEMTPLIQLASVTGVYGLSFLVVWVSLAFYSSVQAMIRNPTTRYVWLGEVTLPLIALMLVFNYGLSRIRQAPLTDTSLRVTFIQPAVPQTMIWDSSENTNRFNQLRALTQTALATETDLLLWPEAALPELTRENHAIITNLIQQHHVWMMFNTDDVVDKLNPIPNDRYDVFNAAYLFNPEGQWTGVYHKRQLVIFGEYIPLVDLLPFVKWFTPITGGYTSGRRISHFDLTLPPPAPLNSTNDFPITGPTPRAPASIRIAPLICFEDTFPHHVRDQVDAETDLLVNLTNDGWFGESAEQWQHLASAALRAVEFARPLLRCCNNGVTCWFDAQGRMREIFRDQNGSEYGVGYATWSIPFASAEARDPATFYHRHGDWFGWTCVGVSGVLLLWRYKRQPKV